MAGSPDNPPVHPGSTEGRLLHPLLPLAAGSNAMPGRQFRADLGQRQVRLISDKRQDRLAMPTQARAMVTTHWSGARLTLGTPPLRPADRGALAHPETLGRRAGRTAGGYGRRQAIPQVLR